MERAVKRQKVEHQTSILKLNDDCLEKIFSYFDLQQLIKLEKICVRFKAIAEHFYKIQTELDIDGNKYFDIKEVQDMAARVGPYVCTLKIVDVEHILDSDELKVLLSKFTRLKTLVFKAIVRWIYYFDNFHLLTLNCKQTLEHLHVIGSEFNVTNEGLLRMVQDCPNLKTLDVRHCRRITIDLIFKLIPVLNQRPHNLEVFAFGSGISMTTSTEERLDSIGSERITFNWTPFFFHDDDNDENSENDADPAFGFEDPYDSDDSFIFDSFVLHFLRKR